MLYKIAAIAHTQADRKTAISQVVQGGGKRPAIMHIMCKGEIKQLTQRAAKNSNQGETKEQQ